MTRSAPEAADWNSNVTALLVIASTLWLSVLMTVEDPSPDASQQYDSPAQRPNDRAIDAQPAYDNAQAAEIPSGDRPVARECGREESNDAEHCYAPDDKPILGLHPAWIFIPHTHSTDNE